MEKFKKFANEWLLPFGIALVMFLAINSVVSLAKVNGMSMYPTYEPNSFVVIEKLAYLKELPEYEDVVVFQSHLENNEAIFAGDKKLIKRVIANQGDHVLIKDGHVYVNEVEIKQNYLPEGVVTDGNIDMIIEDGFCFVMGDNRPNSLDSRYPEVGPISYDSIIGKVVFNIF